MKSKKGFMFFLVFVFSVSVLFSQTKEEVLNSDLPEEYKAAVEKMAAYRYAKENTISFVSNGGMIKENEHAVVAYIDADLLPPAVMLSYQYGIFYWLTLGFDIGGDYGAFMALLKVKQEMSRTRDNDKFFWGWHIRTGFKQNQVELSDNLVFDDLSYIIVFENTVALRPGQAKHQRQVVYLNSAFYFDFDLSGEGRQVDYRIAPAVLGFETLIGEFGNFFIEVGAAVSLNGTETDSGLVNDNRWFPVGKIGFAIRTGRHTAHILSDPASLKKYSSPK